MSTSESQELNKQEERWWKILRVAPVTLSSVINFLQLSSIWFSSACPGCTKRISLEVSEKFVVVECIKKSRYLKINLLTHVSSSKCLNTRNELKIKSYTDSSFWALTNSEIFWYMILID